MRPFVSICTPTYNRRPFISYLIKCILAQDYPLDRIEWVIVDDGIDKIKDLVENLSFVNYISFDEQISLGKKRNIMNNSSKGDIIVYMDDDDYYPVDRVSHAVETLQKNSQYLIAGSSEMHCYFPDLKKIYQFGPYTLNHSTAATFAFRKELLKHTSFSEEAALAEEKHFLKDYSIPLVQLNTTKTILVLSHIQNTFDKKKLLAKPNPTIKESSYQLNDFIKDDTLRRFYTEELNNVLSNYAFGDIKFKPDVLKQTNTILQQRSDMMENAYQQNIMKLTQDLQNKDILIKKLFEQNNQLKNEINELKKAKEELERTTKIQTLIKDEIKDEIKVEEVKVEVSKKNKKKKKNK